VTLTRVIGKGRTVSFGADALAELRAGFATTLVDVGTGDGRYAYHVASTDPTRLVIGIDALDEPMGEIAAKSARKPARGGRPNLVLVRAAIEALPPELTGVADEVSVQLPWGSLLEGIVLARDQVLGGLGALCAPGARLAVTLNGEIWLDSTPIRYEHLPVPTPEYVADVVAAGLAEVGISFGGARYASAAEAKALPTTWARKLGHGRTHPSFVQFDAVRDGARS
jgi:16S rRNA (adenine(1408)-N(1))-methyltransferase